MRFGDIAGDQNAAPPFAFDGVLGAFGVVGLVQVKGCDVGTLPREQHGDGPANAGIGARDDGDHALQLL